jgi:hypothetical protein
VLLTPRASDASLPHPPRLNRTFAARAFRDAFAVRKGEDDRHTALLMRRRAAYVPIWSPKTAGDRSRTTTGGCRRVWLQGPACLFWFLGYPRSRADDGA